MLAILMGSRFPMTAGTGSSTEGIGNIRNVSGAIYCRASGSSTKGIGILAILTHGLEDLTYSVARGSRSLPVQVRH